jgi:hypothetical protein
MRRRCPFCGEEFDLGSRYFDGSSEVTVERALLYVIHLLEHLAEKRRLDEILTSLEEAEEGRP